MTDNNEYVELIADIKNQIVNSRYVATKLVNQELLKLYFRIGMILHQKITNHQWGAKVLERLATDLKAQMPTLRGFSHRNLKNMRQFYTAYSPAPIGQLVTAQLEVIDNQFCSVKRSTSDKSQEEIYSIGQSVTAQLSKSELDAFLGISFTHHLLLLNKCGNIDERLFYMRYAASAFWSVSVLEHYIHERLYQRQGKLPQNFSETLSKGINDKANQLFKDEYLFDFLNLTAGDDERKIEGEIVTNITNFILRMGKGFAFIGNQFRIEVGGQEFVIDLLFYNRILQSFVAFELKKGDFKPEYTGQLNFYLNVLDDKIKLPTVHLINEVYASVKLSPTEKKSLAEKFTQVFPKAFENLSDRPKIRKDYKIVISQLVSSLNSKQFVFADAIRNLYSFYSKYDHLSHYTSLPKMQSFEHRKGKVDLAVTLTSIHLRDMMAIAYDFDDDLKNRDVFLSQINLFQEQIMNHNLASNNKSSAGFK